MAGITKTLLKAVPTIDTATGFVVQWYVIIRATDGEEPPFEKEFESPIMVRVPEKTPEQYSADELIRNFPMNVDHVFQHLKEVAHPDYQHPHENKNDFDVSQLSGGSAKPQAKKTK